MARVVTALKEESKQEETHEDLRVVGTTWEPRHAPDDLRRIIAILLGASLERHGEEEMVIPSTKGTDTL
jgi:hypothetical protein